MTYIVRKVRPARRGDYETIPLAVSIPEDCANVLPPAAVAVLHKAAAIDPGVAAGCSHARKIALDHAIERVKFMYPNFFYHN